ncbi:MAG: TonB family protein [Acidobacteriota bacterium]
MPFNKTEALRRAEEHVSKGEITGAIAIHRMIAQADPYDLNTINALGELYVNAGRTQEAIADFTRIADGYLTSGSGIKAAYLLRKALDLDPSNAAALVKLAEVYLREGMIEKAHDEFIRAGALLVREGQITGALQANHRALTAKPGSPQARAAIAALQADAAAFETGSLRGATKPESPGVRNSRGLASKQEARPALDLSNADEESLIQQLSKAEMLVGYGQVDQAIALLKEVVTNSPDNLDVHGKLKDVYLRNEMIREAAQECLELARIHEARGESARAGEYTMRAGRLAQSSGQLTAEPAVLELQTVAPPSKPTENRSEIPELKVESDRAPAKPPADLVGSPSAAESGVPTPTLTTRGADSQTATPAVSPSPKPIPQETESGPAKAPPTISLPIEQSVPNRRDAGVSPAAASPITSPPRPPVHYSRPVAELAAGSLGLRVSQTPLVTAPLSDTSPSTPQMGSNGFAVASTLGLMRSASAPLSRKKSKWMYAGPMILVCVIALTLGAIKCISMYGAELDSQYERLALASSPAGKATLPGLPSAEDLQPRSETEAVKIDSPPTQTVTPSGPSAAKEIAASQPAAAEPEPKTLPAATGEPVRLKSPAASPPMIAVTDQKGGENLAPRGLPTDTPQIVAPAPSPPPSAPAPQRASALIKGEAVKQVQPNYPEIARSARQEGAVPVEVSIDEKGDVVSARATSGPILLRGAAESAARQWKFRASTRDGKPLATVTTINFRFRL